MSNISEISPNNSNEALARVSYVVKNVCLMMFRNFGELYDIDEVALFTHADTDYTELLNAAIMLGEMSNLEHGKVLFLKYPIEINAIKVEFNGQIINHVITVHSIKVIEPSASRPQKGIASISYDDWNWMTIEASANKIAKYSVNKKHEIIEYIDKNFDVIATAIHTDK